jgi:predicted glycogen debranching enzyme
MHQRLEESILDRPLVHFGREICGELEASLRREWLVTNGIGGYASATVPGTVTRSYHGLLVAALDPPVERTVIVAGLDEWVTYVGERYPLSTHEFAGGSIAPEGYRSIESFRLNGMLPVWTFAVSDALIEKRVWMVYGSNTTCIQYRLLRGSAGVRLEVTPLLSYRSFHELQSGDGNDAAIHSDESGVRVHLDAAARPIFLSMDNAEFVLADAWWWNFHFREETARGLRDTGDLCAAGTFQIELQEGEAATLVASTEPSADLIGKEGWEDEQSRQAKLVRRANVASSSLMTQQLVLAANQFIVCRPLLENAEAKSIIAGYHWFNDWGRDTMISLPGLCLETGHTWEAESILRAFADYIVDGLLPNNFPDRAGIVPGYNTVDATLWYVVALHRYVQATGDLKLVTDLLPILEDIVFHHRQGTHFHISVDPEDGLLTAGEAGVQLTWMDAKVGDWVVTPRIGKPIEINALWFNVLKIMSDFEARVEKATAAADFDAMAETVRSSFLQRYQNPELDHLADVVDGPNGDDWSVRPNQIFALSLPYPLLEGAEARRILNTVGRKLLTSYGLRSLSPDDPFFISAYGGDQVHRDGAYHEGTVWAWLLGPFAEAHFRLYGDAVQAARILAPIEDHLSDAGLGTISEIFDAQAPFRPRGCVAQAWSVAESLRVLRLVNAG